MGYPRCVQSGQRIVEVEVNCHGHKLCLAKNNIFDENLLDGTIDSKNTMERADS